MSTTTEATIPVRVERKTVESDGVVSLTLRPVSGEPLPHWHPGAHVDLLFDGLPVRQYSLAGDPDDVSTYRVGVLREAAGGGVSLYIHDQLPEGAEIAIAGPRNHFRFVPAPRYIFIAGGIGITPVLPMIAAAEAAGADWHLHYGGRSRSTMAFLTELAVYGDRVTLWAKDEGNRIDLDVILAEPRDDTLVYTCGPERLLSAVEARMEAWPHGSLHLERFAPKPLAEPERAGAFEILLAKSGRTLVVPADRSILSIVEGAGVPVLSSCAHGTCGTCDTPVLEGIPEHRDAVLTDDEKAVNDCMMICVSRSLSDRLVLNL
jgi:ferredoxin-NADP reductase